MACNTEPDQFPYRNKSFILYVSLHFKSNIIVEFELLYVFIGLIPMNAVGFVVSLTVTEMFVVVVVAPLLLIVSIVML